MSINDLLATLPKSRSMQLCFSEKLCTAHWSRRHELHTETKVAGRKSIVNSDMLFMTEPSRLVAAAILADDLAISKFSLLSR